MTIVTVIILASTLWWQGPIRSTIEQYVEETAYGRTPAMPDSPDTNDVIATLRTSAMAGDTSAQVDLALAYEAGKSGLPQDSALMKRWLRFAAHNGSAHAMYILGKRYKERSVGKKDLEEAEKWLRRASEKGKVWAQDELDELDKGVDLRKRAENGDLHAQYSLSNAYRYGNPILSIPEDKKQMFLWAQRAASHDTGRLEPGEKKEAFAAKYQLYESYLNGDGTTKDLRQALRLLREVAPFMGPDVCNEQFCPQTQIAELEKTISHLNTPPKRASRMQSPSYQLPQPIEDADTRMYNLCMRLFNNGNPTNVDAYLDCRNDYNARGGRRSLP
jgi:hypothetical protein